MTIGSKFKRKKDSAKGADHKKEYESGEFEANVRSSQPILRLSEGEADKSWKYDIVGNIACAGLLMAFISAFCIAAEAPEKILFALPCAAVFLIISTIESVKPGMPRWIATAVIAVALTVVIVILRNNIPAGLAYLTNQFYDIAERAQAYIYDRFSAGDYASATDSKLAVLWASAFIGLIAALPPAKARKSTMIFFALLTMFAFAYYGLIPSWICMAGLLIALVIAVSRGGVIPVIPVILAMAIVFGAIILINPGENYAISRIDENFRDRFAFNSARIESPWQDYDTWDEFDQESDEPWFEDEETPGENIFEGEYGAYVIGGSIFLAVAVIALICWLLWRRIAKRRAAIRKGIDSDDPREAVTAMFPYSVRWLRAFGTETEDAAFTALLPELKIDWSDDYAKRFGNMYDTWSEAAYSDHEITEDNRREMKRFMRSTIDMVEDSCTFFEKLRLRTKYALWERKEKSGKKSRHKKSGRSQRGKSKDKEHKGSRVR